METDLMYQMYELEQNKLRHQKMDEISKINLQFRVNFYFFCNEFSIFANIF